MLSFEIIDTGNTKTIIFLDESEYQERPGNPMLEIQFPSLSNAYRIQIRPKETNSITTKLIGFTKEIEEFPDGLYNLVYSIDPNHLNFTCKKYFRLTATKCKIKSLLLQEDITNDIITITTIFGIWTNELYPINTNLLIRINCWDCFNFGG